MALRRIQVSDFRCLESAEIEFDPRFTLISGPNAAGKTSVLEAIHVLGRGRSFRTRRLDTLIRSGSSRFIIFGEAVAKDRRIGLGIEGSVEGMRAKLAGERVRTLGELAAVLPVQIIDPEVHRLIEEGPSRRRRFLDWGVFHVEHAFIDHWQRYQQVLKQRNAALKNQSVRELVAVWDSELVRLGNAIHECRARYVAELTPVAVGIARRLLNLELGLNYRAGWSREHSFQEALQASATRDAEVGATQVGPHRAEISLRLDGEPVKDRISRGQQKLLAAALLMAQLALFPKDAEVQPLLLLDDPAAELDSEHLLGLIAEIAGQSVQLVVTSLNPSLPAFGAPGRLYHLSQGKIVA